jgi:hypothetical protein
MKSIEAGLVLTQSTRALERWRKNWSEGKQTEIYFLPTAIFDLIKVGLRV